MHFELIQLQISFQNSYKTFVLPSVPFSWVCFPPAPPEHKDLQSPAGNRRTCTHRCLLNWEIPRSWQSRRCPSWPAVFLDDNPESLVPFLLREGSPSEFLVLESTDAEMIAGGIHQEVEWQIGNETSSWRVVRCLHRLSVVVYLSVFWVHDGIMSK